MSLQHRIDDGSRMVVVSGAVEPALSAARDSVTRLLSDARRLQGYGLLILVHPNAPSPQGGEIHVMGEFLQIVMNAFSGPAAIVVRGDLQATSANLLVLAAGGGSRLIELFDDERDARSWLVSHLGI